MKCFLYILGGMLATPWFTAAFEAEPGGRLPLPVFEQAARAYEQGHFDEAAVYYRRLLSAQPYAAVLHYNLGNTLYRAGKPGHAILHYRRAQWLMPRDPDLAANLRFVRAAAGAAPAEKALPLRWFRHLALFEWTLLGSAAYVLLVLGLSLVFLGYGRRGSIRVVQAAAFLGVLAATGCAAWVSLLITPEAVILEPVVARYAPLPEATEHFALAPGTLVRTDQDQNGWVRIRHAGRLGWVPAATCRRVFPAPGSAQESRRPLAPFSPPAPGQHSDTKAP